MLHGFPACPPDMLWRCSVGSSCRSICDGAGALSAAQCFISHAGWKEARCHKAWFQTKGYLRADREAEMSLLMKR